VSSDLRAHQLRAPHQLFAARNRLLRHKAIDCNRLLRHKAIDCYAEASQAVSGEKATLCTPLE
jgi:hypothetical protein